MKMINLLQTEDINIKQAAARLGIRYSTAKYIIKQFHIWGLVEPSRFSCKFFKVEKVERKNLGGRTNVDCLGLEENTYLRSRDRRQSIDKKL